MAPGILGTLQLAATLVLAIPVALFGIDSLLRGDTVVGAIFLGLAVLMVVLQEYLTTPLDVPTSLAEKVTGRVVKTKDEEERSGEK